MKSYKITKLAIFICSLLSAGQTFADDEIVIQPDYWEGTKCLENGVPWQVPASIYKEAENCRKDDKVLELGTGGSTIFFAKRCKHVTAIETNQAWAARVEEELNALNLKNVDLIYISDQNDIELFLQKFNMSDINILSIDTVHGYNRSAFLNQALRNGISDKLRMLVLDNYGAPELFPYHYNTEAINLMEWEIYKYDDPRWCGNGTKLHIRKSSSK